MFGCGRKSLPHPTSIFVHLRMSTTCSIWKKLLKVDEFYLVRWKLVVFDWSKISRANGLVWLFVCVWFLMLIVVKRNYRFCIYIFLFWMHKTLFTCRKSRILFPTRHPTFRTRQNPTNMFEYQFVIRFQKWLQNNGYWLTLRSMSPANANSTWSAGNVHEANFIGQTWTSNGKSFTSMVQVEAKTAWKKG